MLEGLVMGESVGCLVEEIADYQEKTLFCDNTAPEGSSSTSPAQDGE